MCIDGCSGERYGRKLETLFKLACGFVSPLPKPLLGALGRYKGFLADDARFTRSILLFHGVGNRDDVVSRIFSLIPTFHSQTPGVIVLQFKPVFARDMFQLHVICNSV